MKDLLDLDPNRAVATPKDAATIIVVRATAAGDDIEIFCVERHSGSRFLGGAVVFPGGKLDAADQSTIWTNLTTDPLAWPDARAPARALAVCACRETLEEAALLIADAPVAEAEVMALRALANEPSDAKRSDGASDTDTAISAFLRARNLKLALDRLIPFSRWVTPTAEARRYDTRFFLAPAPAGQRGAHDERETTASFWATPRALLALFEEEKIQLAPPTHRTLDILTNARSVDAAEALARAANLDPICPELVTTPDSVALVLPGDPAHSSKEARMAGSTRFVKHGARWLPG